jgi:hypothetical protein
MSSRCNGSPRSSLGLLTRIHLLAVAKDFGSWPNTWPKETVRERLLVAVNCLLEVLNTTQFSVWFSRVSGRSNLEIKNPGLSGGFALGSSR